MAPPRKTPANTAEPTRRRLTDAERLERARWKAIKPVADSQLDSFYDPETNSMRTIMLWQPKGAAPTDMSRAELVFHDSLTGKLHYCDPDEREVNTPGQLQGRVAEERLVTIPKDFRQAKNADLAVSLGDYAAGSSYSFADVAKWMGVANAHLAPPAASVAPVAAPAPKAAAPVAPKIATKAMPPPIPLHKLCEEIEEDDDDADDEDDDDSGEDVSDRCSELTMLLKEGRKVSPAALQAAMAKCRAPAARKSAPVKRTKAQEKRDLVDAADECARRILGMQNMGAARKVQHRA